MLGLNRCKDELKDTKGYVEHLLKQSVIDFKLINKRSIQLKTLTAELNAVKMELVCTGYPVCVKLGEQQTQVSPPQISSPVSDPVCHTGTDIEQQPVPSVDDFTDSLSRDSGVSWCNKSDDPLYHIDYIMGSDTRFSKQFLQLSGNSDSYYSDGMEVDSEVEDVSQSTISGDDLNFQRLCPAVGAYPRLF